jgi:anti-sigma B factor antagonist
VETALFSFRFISGISEIKLSTLFRHSKKMEIATNTDGEITIVELNGDIDASTAPKVQELVLPLAQSGKKLLLNMTGVPYMSSAGLRSLLALYRQASTQECKLVLVGLSPEIQDTMSVTGFLGFFTITESVDLGITVLNS